MFILTNICPKPQNNIFPDPKKLSRLNGFQKRIAKDGAWDRDQVEHGWKRTDATLAIYQGFLENHFLKVFGACNVQELVPSEINITIKSLNGDYIAA